jgi:hypothetical protein
MRQSWPTALALATAVVVVHAIAASSAAWADVSSASMIVTTANFNGGDALLQMRNWIGAGSERVPALMLVLTMLRAVPPLAIAGLMVGRRRRHAGTAAGRWRRLRGSAEPPAQTTARTYISSWPTEAWVHIDGAPGSRWLIGRSFLRIGQEEDNDIRLNSRSVHRYHAVIRRTTDGDVVINDLSGADGAGVLVNGTRIDEARLQEGDAIDVGAIKLRFAAQPA